METDKTDKTDKTNSHRLSGVSASSQRLDCLPSWWRILYYQSREGADVSSELQQEPVSPAPGAEGSTSRAARPMLLPNSSSQQVAADTGAPAGNLPTRVARRRRLQSRLGARVRNRKAKQTTRSAD